MSDRIAEIRGNTNGYTESELRWLGRQLADDLEAVTARLSAVTDALDREKLARAIKRADDDWYAEKPGTGRGVTITAWSRYIADAVRRHVLGEEAEHG